MSHTTYLRGVTIKDVEAMKKAVNDLKAKGIDCDLIENASPRMYFANQGGRQPYVLKLNQGRYDVGFAKTGDAYVPIFDEHANHVGSQIGVPAPKGATAADRAQAQIGQFAQAYARHAAVNSLVSQGYTIESSYTDEQGNLQIVAVA